MAPPSPSDWQALKGRLKGDLHLEAEVRERFASDESIYAITPAAVAVPRGVDDLRALLAFASAHKVSMTARAGGTSLAGQAVGAGIIVDLASHFGRILSVDTQAGTAVVEPGVVLAALNDELLPHGKRFGPDPSSADSCRIGGMVANNASGVHHRVWGATIDNVESLTLLLANGEVIRTAPVDMGSSDYQRRREGPTLEAHIYREVPAIIRRYGDAIKQNWPKVDKSSSGYRIDRALQGQVFDLAKLMCGSEGTLALVLDATLRIVDRPKAVGLVVFYFESLEGAARGVQEVLGTGPSAVEMIDERVVDVLRRRHPEQAARFLEGTKAALFVEYAGASVADVEAKMAGGWRRLREETRLATDDQATTDPGTMQELWRIRRGIEPMLSEMGGARVPVGFVEDTAVPIERLAEHVRGLYAIFDRHGLQAAAYGHASMGHLHVRPYLDLNDAADLHTMEAVATEVFDQTRRLEGTMSGEHGDGLLRTEFLERFFWETYDAMVEIKRVFDPDGVLNRGKKVDPEPGQMTKYLRAARRP